MQKLNRLFEPGKIGNLEIKNRILMSSMGTRTADGDGYITQRTIDYYVARAKGNVGLIIIESTDPVRENRLPKSNWLFDDCFIPKLRELSEAIHNNGAKAVVQLVHRGVLSHGPAALRLFNRPVTIDICGPSAIQYGPPGVIPREMSKADIYDVIEQMSEGARRVKNAGFDGVELHGAHGYLLSCFFSPLTNKRTDEYGGSALNRSRIGCELIARTREKVGPDFPILFKMNGRDYLDGGVEIDEAVERAVLFEEAGIDALDISASLHGSIQWLSPPYMFPPACLSHLAEAVKKAVSVPVIAVGKISDPFVAENILEDGKADFVAIGRALLADPEFSTKAKEGRFDDICKCIGCNNCLQLSRINPPPDRLITRCTVNPELLREREMAISPTSKRKKVMVIGGGLAGMEASRVLAHRGHEVALYEKRNSLGGQWNIVSKAAEKKELFPSLTARLINGINEAGVETHLNTPVNRELVEKSKPDALVLATGATPKSLPVPGIDSEHVVQANDVIDGSVQVGSRVVVLGGRLIGMEVADILAQQGKKVSVVTLKALGQNGAPVDGSLFLALRQRLIDGEVAVYPFSPVKEISSNGVYVVNAGFLLFLEADTVVLAVGTQSNNKMFQELKSLVPEIYCIGDCVEPRDAVEAMSEAAEIGRRI